MKRMILLSAIALLSGCDKLTEPTAPNGKAEAEARKAEAELRIKQLDTGLQLDSQLAKLRVKVAEACVAAGMVPVVINGNVDCKHRDGVK